VFAEALVDKETGGNLGRCIASAKALANTGYVYMHNFCFDRTEFILIDESECTVYMLWP